MTRLKKLLYTAKAHTTRGRHNGASRTDDGRLQVSLRGVDEQIAEALVEAASHVCPYSLATSGNIEVAYHAMTSRAGETQRA